MLNKVDHSGILSAMVLGDEADGSVIVNLFQILQLTVLLWLCMKRCTSAPDLITRSTQTPSFERNKKHLHDIEDMPVNEHERTADVSDHEILLAHSDRSSSGKSQHNDNEEVENR